MKTLYDKALQFVTNTSWSQFIAQSQTANNPQGGLAVKNIFQQDLYLYASAYLVIFLAVGLVYYYFILNRNGGSGFGFKIKYWVYTLLSVSLLAVVLTTVTCSNMIESYSTLHTFKFSMGLGILNGMYSALGFFIGSIICKNFSIANRTPF